MTTIEPRIEIVPELIEYMRECAKSSSEITLLGIATLDGFNLKTFASKSLNIEFEKLAAMASSICALSNSSAQQLTDQKLKTSTIETESGNILFVKTNYLGHECVVTLVAKEGLSLAQARFVIHRLASKVESL